MQDNIAIHSLVGASAWTDRARRRILQAASYSYPVLITGSAGTGKRLIARAIHAHSHRAAQPLILFSAAQLPPRLAASQLFGHTAGAGELTRHASLGCIGAAQGGTLLIEEIGTLDRDAQHRLLQQLKARSRSPLGSSLSRPSDLRLIATSTRDLREEARAGRFSWELLYRINAITIQTRDLHDRPEDILPLARHILARTTFERGLPLPSLTPAAVALLEIYAWPGNVDELEPVLEQAVANMAGTVLDLEDFPGLLESIPIGPTPKPLPPQSEKVNAFEAVPVPPGVAGNWPTLAQLEAEHLQSTLRRCHHRVAVAAQMLGLRPLELAEKMKRYGLRIPSPTRRCQTT